MRAEGVELSSYNEHEHSIYMLPITDNKDGQINIVLQGRHFREQR